MIAIGYKLQILYQKEIIWKDYLGRNYLPVIYNQSLGY